MGPNLLDRDVHQFRLVTAAGRQRNAVLSLGSRLLVPSPGDLESTQAWLCSFTRKHSWGNINVLSFYWTC